MQQLHAHAGIAHQCHSQIMPEDVHYRQTVEATAKHRLNCVKTMGVSAGPMRASPQDNNTYFVQLAEIEDEFDQQVEELIEVAKDELHLIPLYSCM